MTRDEFYDFLRSAIADRGATALDAVANLAVSDGDPLIKHPCIAALICWGKPGLERVKEIALTYPTSKNTSGALKALAAVAAGADVGQVTLFLLDAEVTRSINTAAQTEGLRVEARVQLTELVLSMPTDDLLIPLGTAFTQISLGGSDCVAEIIGAISAKWLGFGPSAINELEAILQASPEDEPALHDFLARYPQVLDPMALTVWSKPDFHGAYEPDFLVRRSDGTYLVVEIENASKTLVTRSGQLSAASTQAIQQVNNYKSFIIENLPAARSHFPGIIDPDSLVVIGLESTLSDEAKKALNRDNQSRSKLKVVGFDWLAARSRAVLANVSAGRVEVIELHRII